MARIVAVDDPRTLMGSEARTSIWQSSLLSGLTLAGYQNITSTDIVCVTYGDLFWAGGDFPKNRSNRLKGASVTPSRPIQTRPHGDQKGRRSMTNADSMEQELINAWLFRSEELDSPAPKSRASDKLPHRSWLIRILTPVFGSRHFAAISQRTLNAYAREISLYMQDRELRLATRDRVARVIEQDARVLVGYSVGAVVAYEVLCSYPELPVTTFVTIGCPLAIRNLIFDRLEPEPQNNIGKWPDGIQFWHNIVEPRDVVALGRPLRPLFGPRVYDHVVNNGSHPHRLEAYLTSREAGLSIASGLQE